MSNLYPQLEAPYTLHTLIALNNRLPSTKKMSGIRNDMTPSDGVLEALGAGPEAIDLADGDKPTGNGILIGDVWHVEHRSFTAAEALANEIVWVSYEMVWASEEMEKHNDGHSRLKGSIQDMKTYRNELRNYIRDSKTDSPYIEGAKPTTRPGS